LRAPTVNRKPKTGKRMAKGSEVSVGTNAEHFAAFISHVMDVLDKHSMKGMNLVMDNASIHKTTHIRAIIIDRGYIPVYLPPYSPFLNPIDEYWAKLKWVFR